MLEAGANPWIVAPNGQSALSLALLNRENPFPTRPTQKNASVMILLGALASDCDRFIKAANRAHKNGAASGATYDQLHHAIACMAKAQDLAKNGGDPVFAEEAEEALAKFFKPIVESLNVLDLARLIQTGGMDGFPVQSKYALARLAAELPRELERQIALCNSGKGAAGSLDRYAATMAWLKTLRAGADEDDPTAAMIDACLTHCVNCAASSLDSAIELAALAQAAGLEALAPEQQAAIMRRIVTTLPDEFGLQFARAPSPGGAGRVDRFLKVLEWLRTFEDDPKLAPGMASECAKASFIKIAAGCTVFDMGALLKATRESELAHPYLHDAQTIVLARATSEIDAASRSGERSDDPSLPPIFAELLGHFGALMATDNGHLEPYRKLWTQAFELLSADGLQTLLESEPVKMLKVLDWVLDARIFSSGDALGLNDIKRATDQKGAENQLARSFADAFRKVMVINEVRPHLAARTNFAALSIQLMTCCLDFSDTQLRAVLAELRPEEILALRQRVFSPATEFWRAADGPTRPSEQARTRLAEQVVKTLAVIDEFSETSGLGPAVYDSLRTEMKNAGERGGDSWAGKPILELIDTFFGGERAAPTGRLSPEMRELIKRAVLTLDQKDLERLAEQCTQKHIQFFHDQFADDVRFLNSIFAPWKNKEIDPNVEAAHYDALRKQMEEAPRTGSWPGKPILAMISASFDKDHASESDTMRRSVIKAIRTLGVDELKGLGAESRGLQRDFLDHVFKDDRHIWEPIFGAPAGAKAPSGNSQDSPDDSHSSEDD